VPYPGPVEIFNTHRAYLHGWDGDPEPFFLAAEAAIAAGPFEPAYQEITLTFEDRVGRYESIEEARTRLRHGLMPIRAEVLVGQLVEGTIPGDTRPARLTAQVLGEAVTIIGAGEEWEKASRAYQAALVAYEHAMPEAQQLVAGEVPPEPEPEPELAAVAPAPRLTFTRPQRSGLGTWLNENQGVLTFVGVVLAVIAIVVAVVLA
jgi:hypothetical protein